MTMYSDKQPNTKSTDVERIVLPLLPPMIVSIFVLLTIFGGCVYWLQQRTLNAAVTDQIEEANLLLGRCSQNRSLFLQGLSDFLLEDREMQRLWLAGDRSALLSYAEPFFDEMRSRYDITHFYFHKLDRICFLRVHDPNRYGDFVARTTLQRAVEDQKCFSGVELGPLGTFTLRCVQPWRIDGKIVGYIELGQETHEIMHEIKRVLDIDLITEIDKSFLDRSLWEHGMKMLGRKGDWDLSSDYVVVSNTLDGVSSQSITRVVLRWEGRNGTLCDSKIEGRDYRGGTIPLFDAANRHVGRFIVMSDVGESRNLLRLQFFTMLGLIAGVVFLLIAMFRRIIRSIERRLTVLYADLRSEIQRRVATEEELREHRDHLDDLVHQRTSELETVNQSLSREITDRLAAERQLSDLNRELESAVRKLDVANSDLRIFLHAAAHELKAPIRAIGTLADWIHNDCESGISDQGKDYLDLLTQRTRRLDRHLLRIVEFSEVTSIDRPIQEVDLDALVRDVMANLQTPQGIEIIVESPLPTVSANRIHMVQVFENLLSNAVQYMGKPQGTVRIGCTRDSDLWTFSVSDTGPGIEAKYLSRIFDVFQTLSPRDEIDTTGMGLAIVKRIVESYGGSIWANSTVGQGSTFSFTLPAQISEDARRKIEVSVSS